MAVPPSRSSTGRGPARADAGWWRSLDERKRRLIKRTLKLAGIPIGLLAIATTILWFHDARLIDARLGGEQRPMPRIFGRPFELRLGQGLSTAQLEQRLNDVGYAQRAKAELPGEFTTAGPVVVFVTRPVPGTEPQTFRAEFSKATSPTVIKLTAGGKPVDHIALEAPLLAA